MRSKFSFHSRVSLTPWMDLIELSIVRICAGLSVVGRVSCRARLAVSGERRLIVSLAKLSFRG